MGSNRKISRKGRLKRFLNRNPLKIERKFRDTANLINVFNFFEGNVPTKLNLYMSRWIEYGVHRTSFLENCKKVVTETKIDTASLESFIFKYGTIVGKIEFEKKINKTSMTEERFIEIHGEKEGREKYIERNNKSGVTHEQFIEKYGEKKANEIRNSKSQSKESCVIRHGEEIGLEQFKKNCEFNRYKTTEKYYKEKHGDEIGKEKFKKFKERDLFFGSDTSPNQKKYWSKKGFTEEQSKSKVTERQSTFSKEKCIVKYGFERGTIIWQDRQERWKNALNSKSLEETQKINMAKGTGRMNQLFNSDPEVKEIPGILYYIKFFNKEIEFWKIGITSRSIIQRFGTKKTIKNNFDLDYDIINEELGMSFYECFKKEQEILMKNKDNRVIIDYNGFKSTECFNEDVLKECR